LANISNQGKKSIKQEKSNEIINENQEMEIDILDSNPEELEKLSKKQLINGIMASSVEFRGPLPPPQMLRQYEVAMPGAMERIVTMAEKEQNHRHDMDKKIVMSESRDGLLGIISALVISLSLVIAGTLIILILQTKLATIAGSVIDLSGIATIAKVFVYGTRDKHKNDE